MNKLSAASVEAEIGFEQPELSVEERDNGILLSGSFIVTDGSGKIEKLGPLTRFEVAILLPLGFPESEPIVFETGGRIPKTMDRHVYPESKCCCITIWETWYLTATDRTLRGYLLGPVNNYFFGQYYFEQTKEWPLGEWDHGLEGILDAYAEILGIPSDEAVIRRYLIVLKQDWPKGHNPCPCGSGKRLRKCHRANLTALHENIPRKIAAEMLGTIDRLQ